MCRRRQIARRYDEAFSSQPGLTPPPGPDDNKDFFDVYQNYELQADGRDSLKKYLADNGIGTLIQWGGMGIHHFKNLGFEQDCPKTDIFFKKCIMFPMNVFISDDDVHYICDKVIEFYRS